MLNNELKKELNFNSVTEDLFILFPKMIKESLSKEIVIPSGKKINDTIDFILDLKNCELIVYDKNQNKFENPNFVKVLSAEVGEVINRQHNKNSFVVNELKLSSLINLQFSATEKDKIINEIISFIYSKFF